MPKLPVIVYGSAGLASGAGAAVCACVGTTNRHAASAAAEVSERFLKGTICSGRMAGCGRLGQQTAEPNPAIRVFESPGFEPRYYAARRWIGSSILWGLGDC